MILTNSEIYGSHWAGGMSEGDGYGTGYGEDGYDNECVNFHFISIDGSGKIMINGEAFGYGHESGSGIGDGDGYGNGWADGCCGLVIEL